MKITGLFILICFTMISQVSYSQKLKYKHKAVIGDQTLTKSDSLFIRQALEDTDSIMARLKRNPNDTDLTRNSKNTIWFYDGQGNVIGGSGKRVKVGSVKLTDSLTNNYFIMDSTHIFISAYDQSGKLLWKTDPYKDSRIPEYRTNRPVIVHYYLGKGQDDNNIGKGSNVIWITYNNTQFGYLNLRTGKYHWCGQD
jgi:hypothetical protein